MRRGGRTEVQQKKKPDKCRAFIWVHGKGVEVMQRGSQDPDKLLWLVWGRCRVQGGGTDVRPKKNPDECTAFVWVHRKVRGIEKGAEAVQGGSQNPDELLWLVWGSSR